MASLYELSTEYKQAFNELEDSDFDEETIRDTLEGLAGEIEDKMVGTGAYIQNLMAESLAMKEAEARMSKRRKSKDAAIKRLKEYLISCMSSISKKKINTPEFSLGLINARDVLRITDEALIPKKYLKSTTTTVPIKKDILASLKGGEEIPGAEIAIGNIGLKFS